VTTDSATSTSATRSQRPCVVHLTTTDMSLDWLLGPQLRAFADAGYDVVGMSAAGPHVPAIESMGVRHVAVPAFTRSTNPLQDLRAFVQLVGLLRDVRPAILHTHNPKPGILGRIAGRMVRVPLVVNTQHGLYAQPTDRRRRRVAVYTAERIAAAFGDLELVQNPEDVDTLVKRLRVPARKVRLLGNGIDLDRFTRSAPVEDAARALRAEWGIADDEVVCGVVGRLVREKGIVELLEAAHLVRERAPHARMVVIGPTDPGKADAVDDTTMARAADDAVVFAGERTDMPACYAAMDVFVTASWREGFPRAAMEAAAMGLPTLATDIRGNRQVVEHGVTGRVVAVRDAGALAAAMVELVEDPALRAAYGREAVAKAGREFDQRAVIDRTLEAYRSGGRRGARAS
jgi:glycosyltransferase involved in cell wall biosynthesis